jgi:hypothetical protein
MINHRNPSVYSHLKVVLEGQKHLLPKENYFWEDKEDHKKPMQGYAYIIEVLVFWRYNPIS